MGCQCHSRCPGHRHHQKRELETSEAARVGEKGVKSCMLRRSLLVLCTTCCMVCESLLSFSTMESRRQLSRPPEKECALVEWRADFTVYESVLSVVIFCLCVCNCRVE